jgi:hypothetical protein
LILCSDTLDPDYANYLASIDPVGFEEHFGVMNSDRTTSRESLIEHSSKYNWQLKVVEETMLSKSILVSTKGNKFL